MSGVAGLPILQGMGELGAPRRALCRATGVGEPHASANATTTEGANAPTGNDVHAPTVGLASPAPRWVAWLDAPVSRGWCVLWWAVATFAFVALASLNGGPGHVDPEESVYSTWAIAHGELTCAFPSVTVLHEPLIAPVYPLFSGAIAALGGIGHAVPFPSHAAMGPQCDSADVAIRHWAQLAGASDATRSIGYTGWLVLLAGIVAWLRAAGRGRRRWEPATLLVVACLPVVWLCVTFYFHPQDLFALGLALGAMACARRGSWAWAGALIALAVLSQQYALLVAAPLLALAPARRRWHYVGGALAAAMLLVVPLAVGTHGAVLRAITVGSGNNPSYGGTAMWELAHRGVLVVLGSRLLPIALALVLAWWAVRRLGPAATSSVTMMSLVATSLSLRLVFEQNLFPYYFMALAVALVLLEVTRHHLRGSVVAWLAAVVIGFTLDVYFLHISSRLHLEDVVPLLVLASAVALAFVGLTRAQPWSRWGIFLWACVVVCALVTWFDTVGNLLLVLPTWFLQPVFALTGMVLALTPLLEEVRRHRDASTTDPGAAQALTIQPAAPA